MSQASLFPGASAVFSEDRRYRYLLTRNWDSRRRSLVVVGLNPSTADETTDDPTIRRVRGFAERWGYGGLAMLNLFAWRSPDPRQLTQAHDPVGADNMRYLAEQSPFTDCVLCAWGAGGALKPRGSALHCGTQASHVVQLLAIELGRPLFALGFTRHGHPRHPLYLKADSERIPFHAWPKGVWP